MIRLIVCAMLSWSAFAAVDVVTVDHTIDGGVMVSVKSSDPMVKVYRITVQSGGLFYSRLVPREDADTPDSVKYTTITIQGPTTVDIVTVQCYRLEETQYRIKSSVVDLTYPK